MRAFDASVITYQTVSPRAVPRCSGSVAKSRVRSTRLALLIVCLSRSSDKPIGRSG
jgi:hypothetical protein